MCKITCISRQQTKQKKKKNLLSQGYCSPNSSYHHHLHPPADKSSSFAPPSQIDKSQGNTWHRSHEFSNWSWVASPQQPCEKPPRNNGGPQPGPQSSGPGPITSGPNHSPWWRTPPPSSGAASEDRVRTPESETPAWLCNWTWTSCRRTSMARAQLQSRPRRG